jgi:Tuftelin interacting protein N terminal.
VICFPGIWAEDSGDEGDSNAARPSFRGASIGSGKHNYSAPVSFVSGGVQQSGKKTSKSTEKEEKSDEDEEDDDDKTGGRGEKGRPVNSSRYIE